jgi:hypothetical protein
MASASTSDGTVSYANISVLLHVTKTATLTSERMNSHKHNTTKLNNERMGAQHGSPASVELLELLFADFVNIISGELTAVSQGRAWKVCVGDATARP